MNKYALLAIFWFIIGIYALLFRESTNDIPPFPHFDKVSHFALFFIQIWLSANAFIRSKKGIPYFGLIIFALLYAFTSEWAQATFTSTREGSWLDGLADMLGASLSLLLVKYCKKKA
ncbi:VanZ family protein [Mannheimia haemolytica]